MKTTMNSVRKALVGVLGLAAGALPGVSTAEVDGYFDWLPAWTQTANACTVDDLSIADAQVSYGGLSFKSGSSASYLYAWCNVTNPLDAESPDGLASRPNWDGLIVGYRDPDGLGTGSRVTATLFRVSRSTGGTASVAQFDSNKWRAVTSWQEGLVEIPSTRKFDFANYEYHVLISLYRSSTAQSPYVTKLRIAPVEEVPH